MVFKRWQKSPSKRPPSKNWSEKEMEIIGWCLNKNISVAISPDWKDSLIRWQIYISINNNTHTDPNRYISEDVYNKVNEYYKYYYDKYNKQ
tara:strand:+ start:129 stop:401 length:273 start_codon:yes stop_codon:yes gene_type:complete